MSRVTAFGTFRCSAIFCLIPHVGLRFGGLLHTFFLKAGIEYSVLGVPCPTAPNPRPRPATRSTYAPYRAIPYHTVPNYTIPYHTIPYYTTPYHTIQCQTIPYHTMPYCAKLIHTTPYHTMHLTSLAHTIPNLVILHLDVPHHSIQYHNPSDPPHFLPNL